MKMKTSDSDLDNCQLHIRNSIMVRQTRNLQQQKERSGLKVMKSIAGEEESAACHPALSAGCLLTLPPSLF